MLGGGAVASQGLHLKLISSLQGQLEIEFKSSTPASMLLAATTSFLTLAKLLSGLLCTDYGPLLHVPPGLLKGILPEFHVFYLV